MSSDSSVPPSPSIPPQTTLLPSLQAEFTRLKKGYAVVSLDLLESCLCNFQPPLTPSSSFAPIITFLSTLQTHISKIHTVSPDHPLLRDLYVETSCFWGMMLSQLIGHIQSDSIWISPARFFLEHGFSSLLTSLSFQPFHTQLLSMAFSLGTHLAISHPDPHFSLRYLSPLLGFCPLDPLLRYNLGLFYRQTAQPVLSLIHYRTAYELYLSQSRTDEKDTKEIREQETKERIQFQVKCLNGVGLNFYDQKEFHTALVCFNKAISLLPHDPDLHNHIGNCLVELRNPDSAISHFQEALDHSEEMHISTHLNTFLSAVHSNLGLCYSNLVEFDTALSHYNQALVLAPTALTPFQNKLLLLGYLSHTLPDPMTLPNLHFQIDSFFPNLKKTFSYPLYSRGSKIRLGFISGDFINHPVSYFIAPILAHMDRSRFEIYCYSTRIVDLPSHNDEDGCCWRIVKDMPTQDLVSMISHHHQIDILFDLSGHTADNRLDVFAEKPAPIQISYCGYPCTTGLSTIDYRITDSVCDSPATQKYHSEKLLCMDRCFLCYGGRPEPSPACTATSEEPIRFGSFNRYNKLNSKVWSVWEQILRVCPKSTLTVKTKEFQSKHTLETFWSHVSPDMVSRVKILPFASSNEDHARDFGNIDLALDPFPYSGTTTTCECLWFGVPVLTLFDTERGYHMQNVSSSLLRNSGLEDFVSSSLQIYQEKARYWADHVSQLRHMRPNIQTQFRMGPVCQPIPFVRELESKLKTMMDLYERSHM